MGQIFYKPKQLSFNIMRIFFITILAITFIYTPVLAVTTPTYEIPLDELKRIVKKPPVKKSAEQQSKIKPPPPPKVAKRRAPSTEPILWATLKSVKITEEGVRLEIKDLAEKFKLRLDPLNKKIVLQFNGLRYQSAALKLPLGKKGFIQARIGRHPEGIWVVLDTSDTVLPQFDLRQDTGGITLNISGKNRGDGTDKISEEIILLTRDALNSASSHLVTPGSEMDSDDDDNPSSSEEEPTPPVLTENETESVKISHTPYSFVVAEKQTVIQAVISSLNDIKEVYCLVQTLEEGKPAIAQMTKVADTLYTYEGRLPEQPSGIQALRYSIVARDSKDNEVVSEEFVIPITKSSIVPGWQQ